MVDVVDEEIPAQEDVTFMLTPAPSTAASGRSGTDESLVIFCVDTSGSMCVTTEVNTCCINVHLDKLGQHSAINWSIFKPSHISV